MLGSRSLFAALTAVMLAAPAALAQTLPSGVINAPPTVIGDNESIGSGTTLNVMEGGVVGDRFDAGLQGATNTNVVVNISGGSVGERFYARQGSTVTISGGSVGVGMDVGPGSNVLISGGTIGHSMSVGHGSTVTISGGFIGGNFFAVGSFPVVVTGGHFGPYFHALSDVHISGGTFGKRFKTYSSISETRISGGTFGIEFDDVFGGAHFIGNEFKVNGEPYTGGDVDLSRRDVFTGTLQDGSPFVFSDRDLLSGTRLSVVELPPIDTAPLVVDGTAGLAPAGLRAGQSLTLRDGGVLGDNFAVVDASLHVEGGAIGAGVELARSTVSIAGGAIGENMIAYQNSTVTMSGGTVGIGFSCNGDSSLELIGGDFRVNGAPFTEETLALENGDVFTGVLADGAPFIFNSRAWDFVLGAKLTTEALPDAAVSTIVVDGAGAAAPAGLRAGQTLTLRDGGQLGRNFAVVDAALRIEGGEVGRGMEVARSRVDIRGGVVGSQFVAHAGSIIDISGGLIEEDFNAVEGSTINLVGSEFSCLGCAIDLTPGVPAVVEEGGELTGVLVDGSPIDLDVRAGAAPLLGDYFSPDATLTLTLVPDPGDYNGDGQVDATDYGVFQSRYGEEVVPYSYADGNGDGRIDAADYTVWRDNVAPAIAASVPEPAGACLVALAISWATSRKRERPE